MRNIKRNFFIFCTVLFVTIIVFPLVRGYFFVNDYIFFIAYSILSIVVYPKAFFNKGTFLLILYLILLLLLFSEHEKYTLTFALFEFFSIFSALSIINVLLYNKDYKGIVVIGSASLIILAITILLSLPILIENPNAIRDIVGYTMEGELGTVRLEQRKGLASYATIHIMPFIVPIIVYIYKNSLDKRLKLLWFILLCLIMFMVIKSSATTPIILSIAGIIAALVTKDKMRTNIYKYTILGVFCVLFLNSEILLLLLKSLTPYFNDSAVSDKIDDFENLIKFGKVAGQIEGREDLYNISWDTFIDNPLLGSSFERDAGGHAYFVDKLAYLGLIGTIPFMVFLYKQFNSISRLLINKVKVCYLIGVFLFLFLAFFKNIIGFEYWFYLLVVLPGLSIIAMKVTVEKK